MRKFTRQVRALTFTAVLVVGTVLMMGCDGNGGGNPGGGTQTPTPDVSWYTSNKDADTFYISSADQLAGLAQMVNNPAPDENFSFVGKTVVLTKDIDLSAYGKNSKFNDGGGWISIGVFSDDGKRFRGVFDGNGKTIGKLFSKHGGLFGSVAGIDGAVAVKNVGVVDAEISFESGSASADGSYPVGGVVGHLWNGDITGCYFTGAISYDAVGAAADPSSGAVGGVVGSFIGTGGMTNCYSTGDISGKSSVGGVIGYLADTRSIDGCYSTGKISGASSVGGVVGYLKGNAEGSVSNSYSSGTVGGDSAVGGVVGTLIVDYSTVSVLANCYSIAAVNGTVGHAGGVVGSAVRGNRGGTIRITGCAALNPDVTSGANTVGRVVGGTIGNMTTTLTLSDNAAFAAMKNSQGAAEWPNIGADDLDGADISKEEIIEDATIGGRFTAENGWTTENGKLPGLLNKAVSLPEHFK